MFVVVIGTYCCLVWGCVDGDAERAGTDTLKLNLLCNVVVHLRMSLPGFLSNLPTVCTAYRGQQLHSTVESVKMKRDSAQGLDDWSHSLLLLGNYYDLGYVWQHVGFILSSAMCNPFNMLSNIRALGACGIRFVLGRCYWHLSMFISNMWPASADCGIEAILSYCMTRVLLSPQHSTLVSNI